MITGIDVQTDIAQALAKLHRLDSRQFPFVVSLAINRTMRYVKDKEREVMGTVFDRPTPFTLNSLATVAATKQSLIAEIRLRDFAAKGTPASKYLQPQIAGGRRGYKAHEKALAAAGILPAGLYAVPAEGYPLNGYGNIPGPALNRMLSYLRANRDATQNRASNKLRARVQRKRHQFFAITSADQRGLPLGVYERTGSTFKMMLAFVKAPHYRSIYPFHQSAFDVAKQRLIPELQRAAREAIASSRDAGFSLADVASLLPR